MLRTHRAKGVVMAAVIAVTATGLAGCSSSAKSTGGGASGASASGTTGQSLQTAYTGLVTPLPATPVKIVKNANLWVVSCGQLLETCSAPANGAITAAKALGWQTHLCDGNLNPAGVSNCVRQAVAAKASAVNVIGFDCAGIKQSLTEANAAGVKTIGDGGFDCAELGGTQVFSGTMQDAAGMPNHAWWGEFGKLQADWIIGATAGKAKVLSVKFVDETWGGDIQNAFVKELATCSGCSIVKTLDTGNSDTQGGVLRAKFSTALLQTPTANAINVPVDGLFPAGLAQAFTSSGRLSKLKIVGGFGGTPNMGFIRSNGGENATSAFSGEQTGWAGVDIAARLLAGQTAPGGQFPEGIGLRVVDSTHNLPPTGQPYQPANDYQAAYRKLWGLA